MWEVPKILQQNEIVGYFGYWCQVMILCFPRFGVMAVLPSGPSFFICFTRRTNQDHGGWEHPQ